MEQVFFQQVQCPYCGELIEIQSDRSAGNQACIEDCSVCCRPIEVRLRQRGDEWVLEVERDDD
ncbi:MAG: CPXCG motif-containing cysteine-rich protein [Gammaproteobacteria bacterium]|nr:CPXCG motif-containing cysteine-rich protein [Gammaproteobacteria bacterium]